MERVRQNERRRRTGSTVVELIVAFPIMVIALFALAEFGLLLTNQQRLEAASRMGALLASEAGTLPQTDAEFAASPMISAIERHLQQANWDTSAANLRVTLEHNVGGGVDQVMAGDVGLPTAKRATRAERAGVRPPNNLCRHCERAHDAESA